MKKKTGSENSEIEIDTLKNQLARALADYDNLRKRVEREQAEIQVLITAKLIARLLPVIDNFDHVQAHLKDPGLAIAISEFREGLKSEGVETITPQIGAKFDENLHEAVEIENNKDLEEGSIVEVILPGWRIRDSLVIRPAKVKVNKVETN